MNFYFLHNDDSPPFFGGWTVVDAANVDEAIGIYRVFHPDIRPPKLNCKTMYSEQLFHWTQYHAKGNHGRRAVERITVQRMIAEEFKEEELLE